MQLCNLAIVAFEHRQQVARDVVLVGAGQRTDDGAVEGDITWIFRIFRAHQDIARMHVGMEEIVFEHLGEEYRDAVFR